jgi:hypothetical protein
MDHITEQQLREAAAAKILAKRDQILGEQQHLKMEQSRLAVRERELDREFAECRAAARFWGLDIDPPPDAPDVAEVRRLVDVYRARSRDAMVHGDPEASARFAARSEMYATRVAELLNKKAREVPDSEPGASVAPPPPLLPRHSHQYQHKKGRASVT